LTDPEGRGQPLRPESLRGAEADLVEIRRLLATAERGQEDAAELQAALGRYLRTHGPVLRAAASTVGEELRQRLLEELFKWRAQLESQLGPRATPRRVPDTDPAQASGQGDEASAR
jgi:hypothetical protein